MIRLSTDGAHPLELISCFFASMVTLSFPSPSISCVESETCISSHVSRVLVSGSDKNHGESSETNNILRDVHIVRDLRFFLNSVLCDLVGSVVFVNVCVFFVHSQKGYWRISLSLQERTLRRTSRLVELSLPFLYDFFALCLFKIIILGEKSNLFF